MAHRELVDLHNHILYGVDDGAAGLAESVEIARRFVSEGVTRIAATPHFNAGNPPERRGADAPLVRSRLAEVTGALDRESVPLSVLPGNEVYLSGQTLALVEGGTVCTLGGGSSLLVELSLSAHERPPELDDLVFRLQLAGFRVVLAHPERYPFVRQNPETLDTLVAGGLLLQLTAPSLLGEYGQGVGRTAELLLRRGAYSLASSDRHHPGSTRSLAALHDCITNLADVETADLLLCENPARVLDGGTVDRPLPRQPSLFDLPGR